MVDLSIDESGVLMSLTITVPGPICPIMFNSVYFMKFGTPIFDAYKFTIVISF
jgi:hypothetical protein